MPTEIRNIQFFGRLELTEEQKQAKKLSIYFDLIRPPANRRYENGRYKPLSETWLGYCSFVKDGRIIESVPLSYDNQVLLQSYNFSAYLFSAISCQLEATLTSFVNLGAALSLPPIQRNNTIKDFVNAEIDIDVLQISMPDENAVCALTAIWELQDSCNEPNAVPLNYNSVPSQPIPNLLPRDAPDFQLPEIALPYNAPDDNGNTYIPTPTPPITLPTGGTCEPLTVTYRISYTNGTNEIINIDRWGPINSTTFSCGIGSCTAFSFDRGNYNNGLDACDSSVGQKFLVSRPNPPQMSAVEVLGTSPIT